MWLRHCNEGFLVLGIFYCCSLFLFYLYSTFCRSLVPQIQTDLINREKGISGEEREREGGREEENGGGGRERLRTHWR
jgi:hypothetical protein